MSGLTKGQALLVIVLCKINVVHPVCQETWFFRSHAVFFQHRETTTQKPRQQTSGACCTGNNSSLRR
eukprot:3403291-Amphidinium_carterae.1